MSRYVYRFGNGNADGDRTMKALLGGKGANLAEMSRIGLPVPPGFTISAEACAHVLAHGAWPGGLAEEVEAGIRHIEAAMDRRFGDATRPLLLSVRSGAAVSMPGMMDTVLNLGINDAVAEGLARASGDPRFAYDAYRRFLDMFGDVVVGVAHHRFEEALDALKRERVAATDADLTDDDLRELVARYQAIYRRQTGYVFPADPREQLRFSIDAVFRSWRSDRAERYRRIHGITGLPGTAVNVQAMVYGNLGETSGTGVCFTRNPSTGEPELYGEYLMNAQGEDVVAGIRTPEPIARLAEVMPEQYEQLVGLAEGLERHFRQMQDIEFTIQEGELYILQTRTGKRTGTAAVRIAVDFVGEGLVEREAAVRDLVEPTHLDSLLHPRFADEAGYRERVLGKGLAASPGAAVGRVVFTAEAAEEWASSGEPVLLVRVETSPEDVGGMHAAEGILTARGGITSHAAVVARGWGKPCVAGCADIVVDAAAKRFTNGEVTVREGDWVSINGTTGEVVLGREALVPPEPGPHFDTFMGWTDSYRHLGVRANCDTPEDARQAIAFGAEGVGLCRTEHMFFGEDRLPAMRRTILAETDDEREAALAELLPFQRRDFEGMFRALDGRPLTVRLLDPPLHEFLPRPGEDLAHAAEQLGMAEDDLRERVARLQEQNPMLGHRGCRLGITFPGLTEMQVRALVEAALAVQAEGTSVRPELMVPLVGICAELAEQRQRIEATAEAVYREARDRVPLLIGTMIEVPRAVLAAEEIAREAEFFSFGTNDLTQMTFGFSRDDSGSFLPAYVERGILPADPFQTLDTFGVGELIEIAIERGRRARRDLKLGLCGEHGGDPASVAFCVGLGLDYVSCSPYRVPLARLAAAQARLRGRGNPENGQAGKRPPVSAYKDLA